MGYQQIQAVLAVVVLLALLARLVYDERKIRRLERELRAHRFLGEAAPDYMKGQR